MAARSSTSFTNMYGSSESLSLSPITNMAQDHFLPIILLLPITSILSFSMTCKKFRALTDSDPLWESVCRRDWGSSTVNALKSSSENKLPPWKKLYQQVYRLDSVSCRRLLEPGGDEVFPSPRASHSLNLVSGCLILFGGGCEGGRHVDDTWVAYVGNDFRRMLAWQKIVSGSPTGRFGHSCVVIGDSLVLFGGINDKGIRHNDTWIGQVTPLHETFGITMSWRLLDVGSVAPPPRGAHAGCCIDNKRMLIHGGIGLSGLRHSDAWALELSENLYYGTWHEIITHPAPPPRSGHTLTCIGDSKTVLFGGRGMGFEVLNDVWLFDTSEGRMNWVQLPYELQNIPEGMSLPRVGHSATLILGNRLLVYGGEDSYRCRKNDFWLLDINSVSSIKMQPLTTNTMGSLAYMWRKLRCKGYKPKRRSFHQTCADDAGRYLYVFGGMVDGLVHPTDPSGLKFDGELFLVEIGLNI